MRFVLLISISFFTLYLQAQDLDKAKKLWEDKKPGEAKTILLAIDDGNKDYAAARYYLGRIAFDQKQYDEAEDHFEEAIDKNDKVADYHYWYGKAMGQIAKDANSFTQGIMAPKIKSAFENTVRLDPKNLDAYWGLIEFYTLAPGFMGGSWEKAEETAHTIMKIKKAEGHQGLGVVNERREKWSDAESNFTQAYREDPAYGIHLSNFYVRRKKYDKALALTEEALKRNPDDMVAAYQMGKISALSGQKLDLGESCLMKYLAYPPKPDEPRHAAANLRLAQIREKKGNKPEAKKFYEAALKMDPGMKEAKEGLARVK